MILVLFSCSVLAASAAGQQAPTVTIAQGTVVGIAANDGDYFEFHGIPYAGSSSGTNRFKAPIPAPSFEVPLVANRKNIKCVRPLGVGFEGTEDCLIVNIFTPTLDNTRRLPVMVWIKGKEFDHANIPELYFKNFVEKEIVVVSLNFRESILGFLCLGTETAPGNAGLKDIIAGLKWVQANILQFGGNPEDITLFGHGSGAAAVDLVTLSPMGQGLVQKAIIQSGNALAPWPVTRDNLEYAIKVADALGNKITTIEQLSDVFTKTSVSALMGVISELDLIENTFAPCVERHELEHVEPFLTKTPSEIIRDAEFLHIPILIGFVDNEGTITVQEALEAKNRVLASSSPIYFYQFSHSTARLPFVGPIKLKAAAHSKELPYIFDNTPSVLSDSDHAIADILVKRWTNFAKTGNPTSDTSPTLWLPATRQNMNYIHVFDNVEINDSRNVELPLQNPNLNTFWDNIYTSNFHNAEINSEPNNDDDSPDEVIITLPSINTNIPSEVTTATPSTNTNTPSEMITVSPSISTNVPIEVTTTSTVVDTNTPSGVVTVSPTIITNAPIEVTTTSSVIDTNTPSGVITVSPSIITNPPIEVTTTSPVTDINTPDEVTTTSPVTDTNTPGEVSTTSPVTNTNTPDGVTTSTPVTETSTTDGVTTASPSTDTNTSESDATDGSTTEDPLGENSASSAVSSTFLITSLFSLLSHFYSTQVLSLVL